jgi:hypothetical protein
VHGPQGQGGIGAGRALSHPLTPLPSYFVPPAFVFMLIRTLLPRRRTSLTLTDTPTQHTFTCRNCYPWPCTTTEHAGRRHRTKLDEDRAAQWNNGQTPPADAAESSNLGPWKINVENPHQDNLGQNHRFRNHRAEREAWLRLLPDIEDDEKRLHRFQDCGSTAWLFRHNDTGEVRVQTNSCKLRICPVCRRVRQARAARLLEFLLKDAEPRAFQMITLTLRHNDDPLADRLRFLRSCFRRLRQRNCWKTSTDYGYAVLEINWSATTGCWHPHLHIIVRTRFIDWSRLRADWTKITRGSHSVNSRIIDRPGGAAHYLVKYLGKPPDATILENDERATEYYRAINRAKLILPFGKPPPAPKPERMLHVRSDWTSIGRLNHVLERAEDGDHDAMQLLEELAIARERTDRYFHHIDTTTHDYSDGTLQPP